mgnify:CR=1 FL=1
MSGKIPVSRRYQQAQKLTPKQILEVAQMGMKIEKHYNRAMDIEWAYDGDSGLLYIVQARPETVHAQRDQGHSITTYRIASHQKTEMFNGLIFIRLLKIHFQLIRTFQFNNVSALRSASCLFHSIKYP